MNVILCGKTNSGKTTVAKELEKQGMTKVVTYTTRPKRENEIDGEDYIYLTNKEFDRLKEKGFFAETAQYNASFGFCQYGSSKESYIDNSVIVLNPYGIEQLEEKGMLEKEKSIVFYIDVSDDILKSRSMKRGDNIREFNRRIEKDNKDFYDFLVKKNMSKKIEIVDGKMQPIHIANKIIERVRDMGMLYEIETELRKQEHEKNTNILKQIINKENIKSRNKKIKINSTLER